MPSNLRAVLTLLLASLAPLPAAEPMAAFAPNEIGRAHV